MKDLSFFLLKNSLGAKMRKGIKTFCNGDGSTSTLNQNHQADNAGSSFMLNPSLASSPCFPNDNSAPSPPTLEEMIVELELEEEMARKAKFSNDYGGIGMRGRMSCVNNSDILRSARNALNQYPRFSLDGKDAMYRSSFRNLDTVGQTARRKSVCCDHELRVRFHHENEFGSKLPPTLAGESVVWCKPGVVAKLMGLEAMPVPISGKDSKGNLSSIIKRQNLRRRAERHEMERRLAMDIRSSCEGIKRGRLSSSNAGGYCVMKPVGVEAANDEGGWPTRRFL